ncbi:MAG: tetratricopeptide repeat protein [Deltaproteobacteria bacterium]|nr:tetratricopeptide repeat protein [Deltaproteobacteria bacterium]
MKEDVSLLPPNDERWRPIFRRGLRALQAGDTLTAGRLFESGLELAPDQPELLIAAGRERMRQGRYQQAEPLLARAVASSPQSIAATALWARVLGLHLDRRQEAFSVVHRALEADAEAVELHVIRGELLLEDNAIAAARAAFAQAIDVDGADESARVGLARTFNAEAIALSEAGESEPAIFALKRAADLDPEWSGPHVNMGVVFGRLGKFTRAVDAYLAALDRDAENPVALFNLGATYHQLGRLSEAIGPLEDLLTLLPEYPQVRVALANVLGDQRQFGRAIALLLEEIEIHHNSAEAWSALGLAYTCAGNIRRGEECLQQALTWDPGHFNGYHNLAVLYATQHREVEARAVLQRAYHLDPHRAALLYESDESFRELRRSEPELGPV